MLSEKKIIEDIEGDCTFAWFRYKYGDTTPEWLKKERFEQNN